MTTPQEAREQMAGTLERVISELETQIRHLQHAAQHYRAADVPRACAHLWAARGHHLNAAGLLDEAAHLHATKAHT